MVSPGYLDAASAEPLHPAARSALLAALDQGWADPARLYHEARRARMLLDAARESVAGVLGVRTDAVSFCASGTQANHLAVLGARRDPGAHLVISAVEHSSVLEAARTWETAGGRVTTVGVDAGGRVDVEALHAAAADDAALVCLQHGNGEVGTLQPVDDLSVAAPLLVDAAQSVGRLPLPQGWSLLTASAHKWGGPAGVGVLAVRGGAWRSPLPADEREAGRVPGFVNLPAVVAAATALEAVAATAAAESARLSALVETIRSRVRETVPDVDVVGDPVHRLPHIVTFSCLYVDGESLVLALDREGFAVGSGSACTASALRPSHVLAAMGALTHGNVRVSLPRGTPADSVDRFLEVLPRVVARLRAEAGVSDL